MTISNSTTVDTITISSGDSIYTGGGISGAVGTVTLSGGGYTIDSGSSTTFTLGDISTDYIWNHTEWENCFPDFDRVKAMCEHYPGLQIALEKFKTVYKLVKDDYDNPKD
jgi:hypothetical protein